MFSFIDKLLKNRSIIWSLAISDFKSRYLGSALGILWAFFLPLVNLAIVWFAFEKGLRASPTAGVPFILWLITGLFPWLFFSEAVSTASNSIVEKSFLVKKVVFQVEYLPLIKIYAALIPFVFLSFVMLGVFFYYGLMPDIFWLQIPYFVFCLCTLVLSLSWLTSSIVVFFRDMGQVVSVGLQLGFWVTPIFWSPDQLPESWKFVIFLNPMSYIVSGYRSSLIQKTWIWDQPLQTLYFWLFIFLIGGLSLVVFKKLRPHFADVL